MRIGLSLQTRLLSSLLLAIVLVAGLQALVVYREARAEADNLFDYHMQQTAEALRSGVGLSALPPLPDTPAGNAPVDMLIQVWRNDGLALYQSATGLGLPQRAVMGFSDLRVDGRDYRLYSVQTAYQVIQVAQELRPRQQMARNLAWRAVWPVLWMAPLLMVVAWWVVHATLRPLGRVSKELASRQADALTPVSDTGMPHELQPLVHEFNNLLARVGDAFEAQQHFVADAAHELRSPLAALRLQVQALERATDDASRAQAGRRLKAGIDRATRLVEQLLALARQQSSREEGIGPVDLYEVVRDVLSQATAVASEKSIDLGAENVEPTIVHGQEGALAMMLRNLVDNAIKYTPAGGKVNVSLGREDGAALLVVQDSGPGIAPAERERVADRFYRVPGTEESGSGLGLAIVETIARAMHASVLLDESPELGGLRVRVRFPGKDSSLSEA